MKTLLRIILFMYSVFTTLYTYSQQTNFSSGSFIVNMGVTPQTVANGLKPYGMVYDLVRNYDVPVYWAINPNKLKDGTDFIYNGTAYKGGTFIIAAENRTAAVNSRITYWMSLGVVGVYSTSSFSAPVSQKITAVPRWTLDMKTGQIAQTYITNAGIPIENTNWTEPYMLNNCNDIFVMPHADPRWDTHKFLIDWNNTSRGSIWVSCHAVSVLENMYNPSIPSQQANFLALNSAGPGSNSLVPFGSHKDGSLPYNNNSYSADPVMQFMGPVDNATDNGSESIYLPANGGGWRPTTKIGVYDPTQINIPTLSSGKAAVIVYGKGYGDPNRGWVMYEAGHSINGTDEETVAAQRAFLNFSFMATLEKSMNITVTGIQNVMISNQVYSLSATVSQSIPTGPYTVQWTTTCGGTFSNPTSLTTNFTPSLVVTPTNCVISVKVTDACNRSRFFTQNILITSGPRPPIANPDSLTFSPDCINFNPVITVNALANDTEPDGQPMTISSVTGANGIWSVNPDQTIKFIPAAGFYGSTTANYTVCDITTPAPICNTSTITITIGSINQQPFPLNDSYTILEDSIKRLNVLINDGVGNGGGSLKIAGIAVNPLHGNLSINPDNTITYVPITDNRIVDSFYYRVVNAGGYTAIAKVTINFTADGCGAGYYQTCVPGPNPISIIVSEDTYINSKNPSTNFGNNSVLVVDRENTDKHRSLLKFSLPSLTCNPAVSPVITNAVLKLYKSGGGSGLDVDVYRLTSPWSQSEATWNSRLSANTWTTAGGDFDPSSYGTVNVSADGIYTWSLTSLVNNWYSNPGTYPNNGILLKTIEGGGDRDPNFISSENTSGLRKPTLEISYTIPLLCILIPTRAPLAMPDTARTNSFSPVTFDVTTNDYFPNAGDLTVSVIPGSVSSGSAIVSGNSIYYTPVTSFSGTASLQYRVVNNSTGLADTANAYIFVSYTAPVANIDSASIYSGTNIVKNVILNDIDLQNMGINATVISGPKYGIYSASGNNVTYTAPFNFIGRDTITYRLTNAFSGICNETNTSDTAYFIIIVNNRPPVVANDLRNTNPCQPITIDVLQNDSDAENGGITISSVSSAAPAGAGTVTTNGSYIYFTPNPLYAGSPATFTYTITDDAIPPAISNPATVTVNINSIATNFEPIAINDTINGLYNSEIYINVSPNDSDPENDELAVNLSGSLLQPANGTISLLGNGLIKYTPFSGFTGIDVFEYQLQDSHIGISGGTCTSVSKSSKARVYVVITNVFVVLNNDYLNFSGKKAGEKNKLTWTTNETNSKTDYYVERSNDNLVFKTIALVKKTTLNTGWETYNIIDDTPFPGLNYYRLKVVKENQFPVYSSLIILKNSEQASSVKVFPIPFISQLNIQVDLNVSANIKLSLLGLNGNLIKEQTVPGNKGVNAIQFNNLESILPGTYILRFNLNGNIIVKKVIKLKN